MAALFILAARAVVWADVGDTVTVAVTGKDPLPTEPVAPGGGCVSLAGKWRFALDREGKGVEEKWFSRRLDDTVTLPGTLGILCDPNSPALAGFPTEFHGNWQWWQLVKNSRAVILDAAPAAWRPTVQVIDNFARNHKLGLVFETRMGKGRLLVCAIDLLGLQDKPEARQLLSSLLSYAGSKAFDPKAELDANLLKRLFGSE